jgi:hypothetical protein
VNSGTGREMLDGARTLVTENARPGSKYFGRIETAHVGATGHSQGGADPVWSKVLRDAKALEV